MDPEFSKNPKLDRKPGSAPVWLIRRTLGINFSTARHGVDHTTILLSIRNKEAVSKGWNCESNINYYVRGRYVSTAVMDILSW